MISSQTIDQNLIWNKKSKKLKKGPRYTKIRKNRASLFLNFFIEIDIIETYTICIGKSIVINDYVILNI